MKLRRNLWIRIVLLCLATLSLTLLGLGTPSSVMAAPAMTISQQAQTVQTLENTLFAIQYDQEAMETRVARLEETVFGQRQNGSLDARIDKLKTALSSSTLGPLSATPTAPQKAKTAVNKPAQANKTPVNTSALPKNVSQPTSATTPQATPAPEESDYPTISQMEQKLFGKTYVKEDITVRLSRLEKDVFKVPQTGSLANRMDNLRLVVLGDTGGGSQQQDVASYPMGSSGYIPSPGQAQSYTPPQTGQNGGGYNAYPQYPAVNRGYNGQYGGGYQQPGSYPGTQVSSAGPAYGAGQNYGQPMPGNYQPNSYPPANGGDYQASYQPGTNPAGMANGQVSPDMLAAMDEVEKQVIGHTYPSEPITARLDRVENKVFHATSPELPPQERLQRVIAVASAGGGPSSPQAKAKSTFQTLLPIILTILPLILL